MDSKGIILVVDDEQDIAVILKKRLSDAGYSVNIAQGGQEALNKAGEILPDLIILDVMMPEMDGLEVKAHLNEDPLTAHIPVIFLTAKASVQDKVAGFRLRGDDYVVKPFDTEELLARVDVVIHRKKGYEMLSMQDGLTGLANASYFQKQLEVYFAMAKRYRRVFCLAMIDIDDFKKINDIYGHHMGDQVLKEIAERIRSVFRAVDITARYGGDEFAVILQENDEDQASVALSRLKTCIEREPFSIGNQGKKIQVTVSAGIAAYENHFTAASEIFESADKKMYLEKQMKKGGIVG
ncbi:MAG: diguanylate cyclase [Candidatus Omnitrophica bacterium]|nr:diguanylate cyclase [Candidatus Omnitrophota bacterium]